MRKRSGVSIMLRLLGLVKPMVPVMAGAVLFGTIGNLCATLITVLGGAALLGAVGQLPGRSYAGLFAAVLACALLRGILRCAEQGCNHYIAFKLLAKIRGHVFEALRRLAPAKLEGRNRGDLISLITGDVEQLEVFYAHTISPILIAALYSVAMLLFLGYLHPFFALIALAAWLTVGVAIPLANSRHGREPGMEYRGKFGGLNSFVLESLRGLLEIIQYGRGNRQLEELESRTAELRETQRRLRRVEGTFRGLTDAVILLFSAVLLTAGFYLYTRGAVSFAGFVLGVITLMSSFGPSTALSNLANNLSLVLSSGERVLDILDEEPAVAEITVGKDIAFSGAEAEHVDFAYGEEAILRDFSLSVPEGRIVGITGRSGSGKSTLLRLLMRFWDVKGGRVAVSGEDIRDINTASLRDAESFVTQETQLFHDTIAENILIANRAATREQVEEAAKKASLHDFVMSLPKGYDTGVGELGESLSGGERQRIGVARAFLHGAPFLLLDEPTSNLDSLNEGVILKSIREESGGKTVVLVSHRASTMRIADVVHSVEHGRLS